MAFDAECTRGLEASGLVTSGHLRQTMPVKALGKAARGKILVPRRASGQAREEREEQAASLAGLFADSLTKIDMDDADSVRLVGPRV